MANEEHLAILKEGVQAWNKWREKNRYVSPDLSGADLSHAYINQTHLHGANLNKADLGLANLSAADLSEADLKDLKMGLTFVANVDLSSVTGLETVRHVGPSTIGIDTIYRSKGSIPETFLRGAGVPEPFIENMKALVAAMEPIEFYSCFLSYSSKDQGFAERLYADLQQNNVRCWFAPEDMKIVSRECLDFLIPLNERHLRRILKEWVAHYNRGRPHSSLGPGIPEPSAGFPAPQIPGHRIRCGHKVVGRPVLGGLHHEYRLEKVAA